MLIPGSPSNDDRGVKIIAIAADGPLAGQTVEISAIYDSNLGIYVLATAGGGGVVSPETYYLIDNESNVLVGNEGNNLVYQ